MASTKNTLFSFAALALATLIAVPNTANAVAGDIGTGKVLNTSPLYADSGASYHACNAVNVTTSSVTVTITLLNSAGAVLQTAPFTIAAGTSVELAGSGYSGFARCRFAVSSSDYIRANISVFHWTGSYYETLAIDSAR